MTTLFLFAAGALTWTLLEYCIHRWLGHHRRFRGNFFGAEHTRHHSEGGYFSPAWKKVMSAAVVAPLIALPLTLLLNIGVAIPFTAGLVLSYLAYEWFHNREHVNRGWTRAGAYLRRHHFHHHFVNPKVNHGVTSPFWDFVFGTYEAPSTIRVPDRLKMVWLTDPATSEVWEDLAPYYAIRRAKRDKARRQAA